MATIVLQVAGAAIGGAIGGPMGAMIGRAAGAFAGHAIDQKLFSKEQVIRGGRLEESRLLGSSEGETIPFVYGRARLGGQIIWATRFTETKKKKKRGGKGGGGQSATQITYHYAANFAIGICEGEISRIGRIWADGAEIDQSRHAIRIYRGTQSQEPDPLIEAKQGFGKTPAFRGTAYVVFENFALEKYGNRIPQITFEVIRAFSAADAAVKSVNIIPGSTEFGYDPEPVTSSRLGKSTVENRHTLTAETDWSASLDELQQLCPNLENVSLIVSWFGDDLRAGNCKVEPRVVSSTSRSKWRVSGLTRNLANEVSHTDGGPAYGGTPNDRSVIAAIKDLARRGLKTTFYPFIMMDIPADNGLPDPYGKVEQGPYPWRGRISCHPAPGQAASVDGTAQARQDIEAFLGKAQSSQFSPRNDTVHYSGTDRFTYRRQILHYAHLCTLAGGVDTFLIGAEMPGLTKVRDENGNFPFVAGLVQLAGEVKQILGTGTKVSYAADWSEYFGYHPISTTHEVFFNLDPLWASPNIDFIGIDNYMPLSDWRDGGDPHDRDRKSLHDVKKLQASIAGGEGMDWFYASGRDREAGKRTPITDGHGEPWVWAYKDLVSWWSRPHHNRENGVRDTQPTPWIPKSKPIRFTELGCPAVNRGTNQPNVFLDAKSSESAASYFSRGGRDDLLMLRYMEAHQQFWADEHPSVEINNPLSPIYNDRMVDNKRLTFWAWDARPYPSFPLNHDTWSDGPNWYRGHWLNGRIGTCPLDALISQVFADFKMKLPICKVDKHVSGYVIGKASHLREALEPLLTIFNISVTEDEGQLIFNGKERCALIELRSHDLVQEKMEPALTIQINGEHELPSQIVTSHSEIETDYNGVTSTATKSQTASRREFKIEMPAILSRDTAQALSEARLRDFWLGRETFQFKLSNRQINLEPGDLVTIDGKHQSQISSLKQNRLIEVEAQGFGHFEESAVWAGQLIRQSQRSTTPGLPLLKLMNLPLRQNEFSPQPALFAAVFAEPWAGSYTLHRSSVASGFESVATVSTPATVVELLQPLQRGPVDRWDKTSSLVVRVSGGELESVDKLLVLEGRNALAIETKPDTYEILQFQQAELVGAATWRLTNLLRGQLGTDHEIVDEIAVGACGVVLDEAVTPVPVTASQQGIELNYRLVAAGDGLGSPNSIAQTVLCNGISARPLSPVQMKTKNTADGIALTWVRRSRIDSDRWDIEHPPFDTPNQAYRINVKSADGQIRRQTQTHSPYYFYNSANRQSDMGSLTSPIFFEVAQVSANGSPGPISILGPVQ